ncbi:MAG: LssY C-terminal domain-containing protein [Candidatus Saccharimonadales bacterium]
MKKIRGSWVANHLNNLYRLGLFLFLVFVAFTVYELLLDQIIKDGPTITGLISLWLFSAYLVLPRVNRRLSKIYLPNYFIGRTRTADGLLGDPVNLAVDGSREQLVLAMKAAGWDIADDLNLKSSLHMVYSSVFARRYAQAPVSPLFLFNQKQDMAFQKDINNNPRKRHHVRFWKTPQDWWLPGGRQTDWLGAATYDKNVGLSLFTGQVTHKIDADIDKERDFVIKTLRKTRLVNDVEIVKHFTSSYHGRNGGGDTIHTDGSLPFIGLK